MDSCRRIITENRCIHSFQGEQPQLYGLFSEKMARRVAGGIREQINRAERPEFNGGVQYTWLVSQV